MILRDLQSQGHIQLSVSKQEEILKEFRKTEIKKQPSFSEYIKGIREALIKMNFSEEDVAMLLDKYAESYSPLEEL